MQTIKKVIDNDSSPGTIKSKSWYLLRPNGYLPEPRVGHTATYLAREQKVIFIGGANPSMVHLDTWSLDLSDLTCRRLQTKGEFEYRYEHCAFVLENNDSMGETPGPNICVFGGADMKGNKNDLWKLDVESLKWHCLAQQGDVPAKRTLHAGDGLVRNRLTVFGGGSQGGKAMDDRNVYSLNNRDRMWTVKKTTGEPPEPRQGHAVIAVGDKLYVHGGMSGSKFYDDLHILQSDGSWTLVPLPGMKPVARASHGAVLYQSHIYIFGGLSEDNQVMNDFWRLHTDTFIWEKLEVDSSILTGRLDFAMFVVDLPTNFISKNAEEAGGQEEDEFNSVEDYLHSNKSNAVKNVVRPMGKGDSSKKQLYPFIIIHGGMDLGNLYDDFHVYKLE